MIDSKITMFIRNISANFERYTNSQKMLSELKKIKEATSITISGELISGGSGMISIPITDSNAAFLCIIDYYYKTLAHLEKEIPKSVKEMGE